MVFFWQTLESAAALIFSSLAPCFFLGLSTVLQFLLVLHISNMLLKPFTGGGSTEGPNIACGYNKTCGYQQKAQISKEIGLHFSLLLFSYFSFRVEFKLSVFIYYGDVYCWPNCQT